MTFLIQQTLIYAVPLMIVALAGVFAERSGIINLALEGIMVFGAFIGVWFVRILQTSDAILSLKQSGNWVALQGVELLTMLVAAAFGALFSLLLSFASINLRADQTIGGTALNLMAPALVLFFIRIIANQNTLQMLTGDAASWFMIKKSTLGIDKNTDLGFFGETFVNKVYLATYDEAIADYEKAMALMPPPRFVDPAEAIAQICEIRGDYETAIACYEKVIAIEKADWHETQGEAIDAPQRSIARLREKLASR